MSFSGVNIKIKVMAGEAIPATVIRFIQSNGSIMLDHACGNRLKRHGYLYLRFGKYSIFLRTAFVKGKIDGVEGVAFDVKVRRRKGSSASETIIRMVIDHEISEEMANEMPLALAQTGGRNDN